MFLMLIIFSLISYKLSIWMLITILFDLSSFVNESCLETFKFRVEFFNRYSHVLLSEVKINSKYLTLISKQGIATWFLFLFNSIKIIENDSFIIKYLQIIFSFSRDQEGFLKWKIPLILPYLILSKVCTRLDTCYRS